MPRIYCPDMDCWDCGVEGYVKSCEVIYQRSNLAVDTYNNDMDAKIDLGDEINAEDLHELLANCDYNDDDVVTNCELFDCILATENEWRWANCLGPIETI
jgi:hypothetical protein